MDIKNKRTRLSTQQLSSARATIQGQIKQSTPHGPRGTEFLPSRSGLCSCTAASPRLQSGKAARWVPVASPLLAQLRQHLTELLKSEECFSIFLLHAHQLITDAQPSHLAHGQLKQLLAAVQRGIRATDRPLTDNETGSIYLLRGANKQDASRILERFVQSIQLLQPETFIPPLAHETHIVLGSCSFPEDGKSLERLLYQCGKVTRQVTFRSALLPQQPRKPESVYPGIPFLKLPKRLSDHLTRYIPYSVARQLHCAPVGKEQRHLTVAMLHPTDQEAVRYLQQLTGMLIFPVACALEELDELLETPW
ncbi:hypothetical protein [Thermosporothrix hazakensis]|nr:hypothetical protein [Thermosporothrix hazakensis]